jgi:hypothetical protein
LSSFSAPRLNVLNLSLSSSSSSSSSSSKKQKALTPRPHLMSSPASDLSPNTFNLMSSPLSLTEMPGSCLYSFFLFLPCF